MVIIIIIIILTPRSAGTIDSLFNGKISTALMRFTVHNGRSATELGFAVAAYPHSFFVAADLCVLMETTPAAPVNGTAVGFSLVSPIRLVSAAPVFIRHKKLYCPWIK